jgi:WD40 repeat protein
MLFHRELSFEKPPFYKLYSRDSKFQLIRSGVFPCFNISGDGLICKDKTAGIHHNQIMSMDNNGKNRFIIFGDSVKSALGPVWSPDGKYLASAHGWYERGGSLQVWDMNTGKRVALQNLPIGISSLGWTADSRHLAISVWDSTVRVYAFPSLEQITRIGIDRSVAGTSVRSGVNH